MAFPKNIHFTRLVKTENRIREFNFRLLPGATASMLQADVPDDRGNRILFKMQRHENNHWHIVEANLPQWIANAEKKLDEEISRELP